MVIPSPRANAAGKARDLVPIDWTDPAEHRRKIAEGANAALQGKLLCVNNFTLAASSATTTLVDTRIGSDSYIGLMPITANAAAEIGAGTIYVSARGNGTATITHANNAQTDRDFVYCVIG